MADPTPGIAKAVTGTSAALIGGAVAKIIIRILQVSTPGFLDADVLDAIDVLSVAGIVGAATYIVPHSMGNGGPQP